MTPASGDAASDERPFQQVLNKKQRRALARAMQTERRGEAAPLTANAALAATAEAPAAKAPSKAAGDASGGSKDVGTTPVRSQGCASEGKSSGPNHSEHSGGHSSSSGSSGSSSRGGSVSSDEARREGRKTFVADLVDGLQAVLPDLVSRAVELTVSRLIPHLRVPLPVAPPTGVSAAAKPDVWDEKSPLPDHLASLGRYFQAKHVDKSLWVSNALTGPSWPSFSSRRPRPKAFRSPTWHGTTTMLL